MTTWPPLGQTLVCSSFYTKCLVYSWFSKILSCFLTRLYSLVLKHNLELCNGEDTSYGESNMNHRVYHSAIGLKLSIQVTGLWEGGREWCRCGYKHSWHCQVLGQQVLHVPHRLWKWMSLMDIPGLFYFGATLTLYEHVPVIESSSLGTVGAGGQNSRGTFMWYPKWPRLGLCLEVM